MKEIMNVPFDYSIDEILTLTTIKHLKKTAELTERWKAN
jgi:hypothetical protein